MIKATQTSEKADIPEIQADPIVSMSNKTMTKISVFFILKKINKV